LDLLYHGKSVLLLRIGALFSQNASRPQLFTHLVVKGFWWLVQQFGAKDRQNDVVGTVDFRLDQPNSFIKSAAQAVARHSRFFNFATNNYSQTVALPVWVGQAFNSKAWASGIPTVLVDIVQTPASMKSMLTANHSYSLKLKA